MSESEKGGALYRALERIRERFPRVLDNPKAYRLQVLLTDCSENETQSRFQRGGEGGEGGGTRRQGFRCDEEYFYPASTVKLCVAVAALHVLDRLKEDRENDPWAGAANATSLIQALSVNTPLVFKYREDKKGDKGGARACESEEEKEEGRHVKPIVLHEDETNVQGGRAITLGHLIRNVFLVSSNGAFNLLLDFVGRRTLDTFLRVVLGFKHFRIRDYFEDEDFGPKRNWKLLGLEACCGSSRSEDPQDSRVGVRCGDFGFAALLQMRGTRDRSILHVGRCHPCSSESEQPRPETTVRFDSLLETRANRGEMEMEAGCLFEDYFVGSSYISDPKDWDLQSGEREVAQPGVQLNTEKKEKIRRAKDFSTKQQASLVELQDFLMLVVRPDLMKKEGGSCSQVLTGESRAFLLDIMAMKTTESDNPKYGSPKYFPSWNKFFLPGIIDAKHMKQKREKESNCAIDPGVRIYNKLGQAYGFSLDNAYVEETTETGRTAFFLTACLYTNRNGVLNDNCYEYESLGEPFLSQLAEACWLELQSASAV